ncbi:MAG: M14 family zinc carboxypeptidase [Candidatus Thorarchaeota archaeon]
MKLKVIQLLLLTLLLSSFLLPVGVSAEMDSLIVVVEKVDHQSVDRTWADISLLYEDQFHNAAEVDEEIERFNSLVPKLVDLEVIGKSYQGLNISALRITNELNTVQKAKTLVVAHHHGREQITIEMALRFILRLLNLYGVDDTITEFVDTQEIYIIPTINPDTLEYVLRGNHWLRKNVHPFDDDGDGETDEDPWDDFNGDGVISGYDVYTKTGPGGSTEYQYTYYEGDDDDGDELFNEDPIGYVDLNRNYPKGWGTDDESSPDPLSEVFRGPSAFSEPETQAFRDFALQHSFTMAYSLHSGINATYFPADDNGYWVEPGIYSQIVLDFNGFMSEGFNDVPGYPGVEEVGPRNLERVAYSGYWEDWMYVERGTTAPITFELYHNATVDGPAHYTVYEDNSTHYIEEFTGIYGYFAPVESAIERTWQDMMPGFDYLLENTPILTGANPTVSGGIDEGDSVIVCLSVTCQSILFDATDSIYGFLEYGASVASPFTISTAILDAGETGTLSTSFDLPTDLGSLSVQLYVGNNFTGYVHLRLSVGEAPPFDWLPIVAIGSVAMVAIVIVIVWRKL